MSTTFRKGDRGFDAASQRVELALRSGVCYGRTRSADLESNYVSGTALRMSDVLVIGPKGGFAAVMTYAREWFVAALCGKGDGKMILDRVRTAARRAGADRVTLSPTPSAKPFYRRLGFAESTKKNKKTKSLWCLAVRDHRN